MDDKCRKMISDLHDRQEIKDVLCRYSRGVDRQDRDILLSCYHDDAVDDHGMFVGNANDFFDWTDPSHLCQFRTHQHIIANHVCELDGDVAHCETYYMFAGMTKETNQLAMSGGRYVDRMEKRDGVWRIAVRKCVIEWGTEGMVSPDAIELFAAVGNIARDHDDLSYDRPLVIDPQRVGLRIGG